MDTKVRKLLQLSITMLKIGLFTFGGGYAMIALLENELVQRRGWLTKEQFLDTVAVTSSAPGSVAVNAATFVGYRIAGIAGAAVATGSVCLPSFVILYLISLFFDAFLSLTMVQYAFRGIQACVVYLILTAGIRMLHSMEKNAMSIAVFAAVALCMIAFSLLSVSFSTVYYILLSGAIGVILYTIRAVHRREGEK